MLPSVTNIYPAGLLQHSSEWECDSDVAFSTDVLHSGSWKRVIPRGTHVRLKKHTIMYVNPTNVLSVCYEVNTWSVNIGPLGTIDGDSES